MLGAHFSRHLQPKASPFRAGRGHKDIISEIQRVLLNRRCTDLVVEALRKEVPISLVKDLHEISRTLDIEEIIQKISPVQMRAPKLGEHNDLFKNSG